MMSTSEEMTVIGRMVTEYAEVKRRVTVLEERAREYGAEITRIGKALSNPRFGSLEIELAAMPAREAIKELLADLRAARERRTQLLASLREFGLEG
jgi:hypothetical protein